MLLHDNYSPRKAASEIGRGQDIGEVASHGFNLLPQAVSHLLKIHFYIAPVPILARHMRS